MPAHAARGRWAFPGGFGADQEGAGTVFTLFVLVIVLLLGGLAVDVANAWRHGELMQTTADVAARAGTAVLAQGGSAEAAEAAALAALELNMPQDRFGRILHSAGQDVRALHLDAANGALSADGPPNAVLVGVHRGAATDNPVPTLLLRYVGRGGWSLSRESAAAVLPTQRCQGANGIYARGVLVPGSGLHVGDGYCLYSQEKVVPEPGSFFADGAGLGMPDLARCGTACAQATSDGIGAAAFEANFIRPDLGAWMASILAQFDDPRQTGAAEASFFAGKPLSGDPQTRMPLDEVGIAIDQLTTGTRVEISPLAFSRLRAVPQGLIYSVRCSQAIESGDPVAAGGLLTLSGGADGRLFENFALLTDCALHIDATARLQGVLIIATGTDQGVTVTADFGARIGSDDLTCPEAGRSTLMTTGSVLLPAGVLQANVGLVVGNDLRIAASPAGQGVLVGATGLGIHAGGTVSLDVPHDLAACGPAGEGGALTPGLAVIRHVQPGAVAG